MCAYADVAVHYTFDNNRLASAVETGSVAKMRSSNKELYFLDTLLTVCIIHQLAVVHWRGVWKIFDVISSAFLFL